MFKKPSKNIFESETIVTDKKITLKSKFTIKNFSLLRDNFIESPEFSSKYPGLDDTWSLVINPNLSTSSGHHLTLYLIFISAKENEQLPALCKLSIITSENKDSCSLIESHNFTPQKNSFGRNFFIAREDLLKSKEKYLPSDNLTISCEIEIDIANLIPRLEPFFRAPQSQENKTPIDENKEQEEASKMMGNFELNNNHSKMNQDIFKCDIDTTNKKIIIKSKFTIKNFSLRQENVISSPEFSSKNPDLNDAWSLMINPNLFTPSGFHVAVYLKLLSSKSTELQAKCKLTIITADNKYSCNCIAVYNFTKENTKFGRDHFILRHDLLKSKAKYLPGDNLTILCVIDIDTNVQQSVQAPMGDKIKTPITQNENQQVSQNPEINKNDFKKISQDLSKDVFEYETGITKSGKKITLKAKFTIRNFSLRQEALIASPEFSSKYPNLNDIWGLDIHPKILTSAGYHLSVNLIWLSAKANEELSTKCKLSIINSENEDSCTCSAAHRFTSQKNIFGRDNFMVLPVLLKSKEKYLPNDNLTISCIIEINIVGSIDEKFDPTFHRSFHAPQIPLPISNNKIKNPGPEVNNNNNSEKINQDVFKAKANFVDKNLIFTNRWTIKNFSSRKEIEILSPKFSLSPKYPGLNEHIWRLIVNPKSLISGNFYVAVNLILLSIKSNEKLSANCKLSILTSQNEESCNVSKPHIFTTENKMFGKDNFIVLHDLLRSKEKYLPDDNLTILCEIVIAADEKVIPKVEEIVDAPQQQVQQIADASQNKKVEQIVPAPKHQQVQQGLDAHQQTVNSPQQQNQKVQQTINSPPQQNQKIQQVANGAHYQVPRTHYDHHEYDYHEDYEMNDMFAQLLLSRQSTDAIIIVGTKAFPVIKGILAARSPYFSALFKSPEYQNNGKNEVELKDIRSDVFAEILQFIYSDRSPNVDKMALDLLAAANKYKLEKLKDMSEKALLRQGMTFDYAPVLFIKADLYNARQLRDKALNFIVDNLKNIIHTDTFKSFKDNYDKLFMEILEYAAEVIHEYASTIKQYHLRN